jgi:hypothetical protein
MLHVLFLCRHQDGEEILRLEVVHLDNGEVHTVVVQPALVLFCKVVCFAERAVLVGSGRRWVDV